MRGNVVDLAVAVIIGAAFSAIVGSLISDVITPLLLKPAMDAIGVKELEKLGWNGVLYGKFIASVLNFLVTAFIVFLMIKAMNKAKIKFDKEPEQAPKRTIDQELLTEIRDLLKSENQKS